MKRILLPVVLGASLFAASSAFANEGYLTSSVSLRAGPDSSYPRVVRLHGGTTVEIEGCVDDLSWCDVSDGEDRGWVSANYLQEEYEGRRVLVPSYGVRIGIPIVGFVFGDYWDHHYRSRSWYHDRDRWSRVNTRYYHGGSSYSHGGSYGGHSGGSYGGHTGGSYSGQTGGSYSGTHNSTTRYHDTQRVESRSAQPAYSSGYSGHDGSRHTGTAVTAQPTYQARQTQSAGSETRHSHAAYQAAPSEARAPHQAATQQSYARPAPGSERNANPPRSASGEQHSAGGQARAAEVHDRNAARAQAHSEPDRADRGKGKDKDKDKDQH